MTGERKAALALAALNDADRAWMLERLPQQRRARVASMLGELGEMRVSFDRELARQLVPPPREEAPAAGFLHVLEREPDWLVALVLRARNWSWRDAFLQRAGAERARRLAHDAPAAPAKLAAALVAALEAKVRAVPVEGLAPSAKPSWRTRLSWRR